MANATVPYVGPDGRLWIDVSANKTMLATEIGWVQNIITDAITFTLLTSAALGAGANITFRNGGAPVTSGPAGSGANGTVGFVVTPGSGDGVTGNGFAATINKGLTYIKGTGSGVAFVSVGNVGDEITLIASGANTALAWQVNRVIGKLAAWTRTP